MFHLHPDLLENEHGGLLLELWKAASELGALLFYHAIDDMSTYLHLVTDIRNGGWAILFLTEIFKCWNSVFWMCSVLLNHHAPSHDIAAAIADLEHFKHQVSGGWWRAGHGSSYVRAGEGVREMFQTHSKLQRRLGWADPKVLSPGTVRRASERKHVVVSWEIGCLKDGTCITIDARTSSNASYQPADTLWEYAQSMVASSTDVCKEGMWVFYDRAHKAINGDMAESPVSVTCGGCIRRIIIPASDPCSENGLVQVERFAVSSQPDAQLNMPVLYCECAKILIDVIPVQNVAFIFNAQHDCLTAECAVEDQTVHQERRLTSLTQKGIRHGAMQQYFINMHALHNAALIRKFLPCHFSKPKPFYDDRVGKHREFADKVSSVNTKRRDATAAKAQDT
ncbi:hypothetical protein BC835DRAFT_1487550 [Cytidiella melzeri]|nr:hypothetical protein BC835DRAFT_1487550 [Cytidiella melzeri]